tara:strand:+ start:880 stop:1125 length:246 start_codon:yes stop_codon:yes gene_type:complete
MKKMINKPTFIIWVSITIFILIMLSDYYGYKTKLAVNNFAEERGKNQIIKEAKFPNDYGQYLVPLGLFSYGIYRKYSKTTE